ncbi:MAG TPA: hypothetical protein PKC72_10580 [Chitinophagaceae bacterium]|nr:hypothetical protein [Chitinophagaceae bacterium]
MKKTFIILSTLFIAASAFSQKVSTNDFKALEGNWSGKLTYLDYTSNTEESISTTMTASVTGSNMFELNFRFPGESGKGGSDIYKISEDGKVINDMKVLDRKVESDGTLKIVLEQRGPDGNDNKWATFHHVLEIRKNNFRMTKMVKFDDEKNFFRRNQFVFTR